MLEGLEISEVTHQIFLNENEDLRFDAEFFQKRFLKENLIRSKYENLILGDSNTSFITDGQHGYHEVDYSSQIHMLTAKNTKNWFANITDAEPIARWVDEKNKRSSLAVDDIILSTRGTVGLCAIVRSEILPANIDQDIARIKLLTDRIYPEYLLAYLNSRFGQDWMLRNQTGMVQQGLSLQKVRTFPIPILSDTFQTTLKYLINKVYKINTKVQENYTNAEKLLLEELGLQNWQPTQETITEKKMSEFLSSGRVDAEYYQPKYDEIESIIKNYHNGYDTLKDLCILIDHGKQPPYIENGTIRVFSQKWIQDTGIDYDFLNAENEPMTSKSFADSNPDYVCKRGDIVHYSVGANIGFCHTYLADEPMMPGSFITLIRADESLYNPICLGVVLNSIIGRMQSEKRKSGTAQPYVYPSDLRKFLIPNIEKEIQENIATKVQESFELRKESKCLLDLAKFAVEVAIEQGEEEAIKMLEKESDK